nr:heterogeneous nuclear ribonucleoprotein U-like protein 1 [Ipomoea batatas]
MLSEKRDFPITGQTPEGKKAKLDVDGEPSSQPARKFLNVLYAGEIRLMICALHEFVTTVALLDELTIPNINFPDFKIGFNGLLGSALHEKGFAYCWSGARSNAGIKVGKYCFGCKIISEQPVIMNVE